MSVKVYDKNRNLQRILSATDTNFTFIKGKLRVTTTAGSGKDKANQWGQYITLGPEYVLESNKHLYN